MTLLQQKHQDHDQSEFEEWMRRNQLRNSKPIKVCGPMGTEYWQQPRQFLTLNDEEPT